MPSLRLFLLMLSGPGSALVLMGCPSADVTTTPRCDEARRCVAGAAEVCGEDGQTYACGALARCEGVIVDPSGLACMSDKPDTCEPPVACRLVCEQGFRTDARGCEICECEEVLCPPIAPPDCSDGERLICDADDVCGTSCRCEAIGCPIVDYAPCPDSSAFVCEDLDGDGCEECRCEQVVCPPDDGGPCDAIDQRVCEDLDGDGCEECRCERVQDCPAPPMPAECPGSLVPVLRGEPCGQWSCEAPVCEFVETVCDTFEASSTCSTDPGGCQTCWCEPASCPATSRPECDGQERIVGVDDRGCAQIVCEEQVECAPGLCALACEHGFVIDEQGCVKCECVELERCYANEDCAQDELCLNDAGEQNCPWGDECELCDGPGCDGTCQPGRSCDAQNPCGDGQTCEEIVREECCPSAAFCVEGTPACKNQCVISDS